MFINVYLKCFSFVDFSIPVDFIPPASTIDLSPRRRELLESRMEARLSERVRVNFD